MVWGKTFLVGNVNSSGGWSLPPRGEEESAMKIGKEREGRGKSHEK